MGHSRNLFSLTVLLVLGQTGFTQKIEYGITGSVQVSSIYKPAKDSFSSAASWGVSMFAEKKLNTTWSLSLNPGYQQVQFNETSTSVSWNTGHMEMPVKLHYTSSWMHNGRLNMGLVPSYQVTWSRLDPSGSNPGGKRSQPLTIKNPMTAGLTLGLDFKISDGFHLNAGYYYFLNAKYRNQAIEGRPAHWQFGLQVRLNELADRKVQAAEKVTLTPFQYLVVLLPEKYASGGAASDIPHSKLDSLLLDAFYQEYQYSPVIFVRDTVLRQKSRVEAEDILYTLRGNQVDLTANPAILFVGEYFYRPSSGWHYGLFLLNEQSQLIDAPFQGAYMFPFSVRWSEGEWKEILEKKVAQLNDDLNRNLKK